MAQKGKVARAGGIPDTRNDLCIQLQQNYLEDMKEVIDLLSVLRQKHINELKQIYETDEILLLLDDDVTNKPSITTHSKDFSVNHQSLQGNSSATIKENSQNIQNESYTSNSSTESKLRKHYHHKLQSLMKQMQKTAKLMHNVTGKSKHKRKEENIQPSETDQRPQENNEKEFPTRETLSRVRFQPINRNDYKTYLATSRKQYVKNNVGKPLKYNVATNIGNISLSAAHAKKQKMYGFNEKTSSLVANISIETLDHYGEARNLQNSIPENRCYLSKSRTAENHNNSNATKRQIIPTKFLKASNIYDDCYTFEQERGVENDDYVTGQENEIKPKKMVNPRREPTKHKERRVDDSKYMRVKKQSMNEKTSTRDNDTIWYCDQYEDKEIHCNGFPKKERNYKVNTNFCEQKHDMHTATDVNVSRIVETRGNPFQSDTSPDDGFDERKLLPQTSSFSRDGRFCPCLIKPRNRKCTTEKRYCKTITKSNNDKENTLIVTDFNPMENSKVISVNIIFKSPKKDTEKVKKERVNKGKFKKSSLQKKVSISSIGSSENEIETAEKCVECVDPVDIDSEGMKNTPKVASPTRCSAFHNINNSNFQTIERVGEYYYCSSEMRNAARSPVRNGNTIKSESKRSPYWFSPKRRLKERKPSVEFFYIDDSKKDYDKISDFSDNETYLVLI